MRDGTVRVPEAHIAIDCGFVANPERVLSQMQGACVFGMTAAMHSGITFDGGAVQESNFHDYPMVRADNFPETRPRPHRRASVLGARDGRRASRAFRPFVAALVNAIANASGKRIRNLPIGGQLTA